jgi:DNA-binding Lrp family transcriptional regulator
MALDPMLVDEARAARDRLIRLQHEAELAQVDCQHAIRRLHASGGSLRAIARELGISYQRVHQIVDLATGKGAIKSSTAGTECSFCGARREDVRKLIAGPGTFICEACVDLAAEVVDERAERTNERTRLMPVDATNVRARCSFCGKRRERVEGLAEAPDRPSAGKFGRRSGVVCICNDCLALCGEILSEQPAV